MYFLIGNITCLFALYRAFSENTLILRRVMVSDIKTRAKMVVQFEIHHEDNIANSFVFNKELIISTYIVISSVCQQDACICIEY